MSHHVHGGQNGGCEHFITRSKAGHLRAVDAIILYTNKYAVKRFDSSIQYTSNFDPRCRLGIPATDCIQPCIN